MRGDRAVELLTQLRQRGLTIVAEEGRLRIGPKAGLTPELREALIAHKSEILPLLQEKEIFWRVEAMSHQVRSRGSIPFLVARETPFVGGRCLSCGDALSEGQLYRCQPCMQAAIAVISHRLDPAPDENAAEGRKR